MKTPTIKIKDDPEFDAARIEVTVRFDLDEDEDDPGTFRDVQVTFLLERGGYTMTELRTRAVTRAREILREALNPASS